MVDVKDSLPEISNNNKLRVFLENSWPVSGATQSIDAIDGLRAIAVFLTMMDHIIYSRFIWTPGKFGSPTSQEIKLFNDFRLLQDLGTTGVELFFVISGFLLFLPYARTLLHRQAFPSAKKFYKKRAFRILPAYWVSLVLIIVFLEPVFLQSANWYDVGLHFFLMHDVINNTRETIDGPYWTMAVESHFYLLLPLIAWLIYKVKSSLRYVLFCLLLLSSPAYGLLQSYINHHPSSWVSNLEIFEVFTYMCVFAGGMLISLLYVAISERVLQESTIQKIKLGCKIAGIVGIMLLICYEAALYTNIFVVSKFLLKTTLVSREVIIGSCFVAILLSVLFGWNTWRNFLSFSGLRFIGIISYSLYIWNVPIYTYIIGPLLYTINSNVLAMLLYAILTVIILIPFAFLSYYFVERPFIKFRRS